MKLQARNFVVRKPKTVDITVFFKKFCIASRTKSDTNFDTMGIRLVSNFFCAMGRPVLHESAQRVFARCALAQRTGSLIPFF